ncbi:MAG: hypothetical protein GY856_44050 [bacterium]|nr:hypothetical protein [bacterium]
MNTPTNDEILALLDQLDDKIADDLESASLDFKPWREPKKDMAVAMEYAVCFANAEGGVVVFGVADKKRGRAAAIHGVSGYDLDVWRRGIYDATQPHLEVEVEVLAVPEGTGELLMVRAPKGTDPPYGTAQGLYKIRVGKNCMGLDPRSFDRMRVASGHVDWSRQPVRDVTRDDLDPVEIARARNVLLSRDRRSPLPALDDEAFLTALGALRDGAVTHTGLLLFGREAVQHARCPQHQVHYAHQVSDTELARNDFLRYGLLRILERITMSFEGPANPEREVRTGFFKMRIPAYPVTVMQEALLNAMTHRDYAEPDEVFMRQTDRELTVISPGGFIGGITPRNLLRHDPVSRNATLAEAFLKLHLVEKSGIGRRRIVMSMLEYGKPVPVWETDGGGSRVILRLFNGTGDQRLAAWLGLRRERGETFSLEALLVLSHVRARGWIDAGSGAELLQLPPPDAQAVLAELSRSEGDLLRPCRRQGTAAYELAPNLVRELEALVDVPERDEKVLDRLVDMLAAEPGAQLARRLRQLIEQKGVLTREEAAKLGGVLASDAGDELRRSAPIVFASLNGIVQASTAD